MQHRYSMRLIAYILLFNHGLMSCYNPSLSQKNQRVPMHPEDVIINEPIEYTSTAFMTLEPVHKPTDLGTNEVFLLELFIGSKLTASGNIESEEKTIEEPISFQHVASEIRAEKAIKEKTPFRRVSFKSRAEEVVRINKGIESEEETIEEENPFRRVSSESRAEAALRINKGIESEEETIEEPMSFRHVVSESSAEAALRIKKKGIESEEEAIAEPISFWHFASEIRSEKAIEKKNPFRRVSCESRAEEALRIKKKGIESEEEAIEAPISFRHVASESPAEAALRIKKDIESEEEAIEAPISFRHFASEIRAEKAIEEKTPFRRVSFKSRAEAGLRIKKKGIESEEKAIEAPISFRHVASGIRSEKPIKEKNQFRKVSFESPAEEVLRRKKALEREAAASRQRGIAREAAASRHSASSRPKQGCFSKLWGAVCNVGRSIWHGCKQAFTYTKKSVSKVYQAAKRGIFSFVSHIIHGCKQAFTYAKKSVSKVYQAAKRGIFSFVSRIIHGCKKAFTYANPLVTKVYQTAKKMILSTINGFKKAVIYAKKNLWPKVCKVAKFIYNRIVKPVSKFIWKHKKKILIGIGIFTLVGIVVCYPYVGTPTIIGMLSTILFGKDTTTSDKTSSQNNQDNINLFQFIVEYFLHRKQENKPNLNGSVKRTSATGRSAPPKATASQAPVGPKNNPAAAVKRTSATGRSAPPKATASQAPVAPSDHASWQKTYSKLTDFAGSIKERISDFGRNLVDKVSHLGSWCKKQSSTRTTTSPLPVPTFVSPNVSPPMPTPARESSEAIASHEPRVGQRLEEEKVEEDFQAELAMQALEDAKDEAVAIEEISFDNLEEAKLAAEAYLESFQQATPSQQAVLRQKGMALVGSIESLKKITKDQYRTTGRSFVFTDMDAHSFPLFVAQRKDLHAQYVGFKSLRDQLQVSMSLSKAEARACGVRVRYNPATDLEEYYSSSEERDWSDQAIHIKQAVGSGIGSALKNQIQFIIPSLVRLALDPKGTIQAYIDLLQAIPQLPEIVKAYYEQFQDFNEEEKAKALSQLLTEVTLTLLPIPKLSVGQIAGLKNKLSKAAEKVGKKAAKVEKWAEVVKDTTNTIPRTKDVLGHIFRSAPGHVNPSSVALRNKYIEIFESVANKPQNLNPKILNLEAAKNGVQAFTQTCSNGKQVWVFVRDGKIFDAGINIIPK
jgi:hypothetical protein